MYTHINGKGAGKYNGMAKAGDWIGKRVVATRQIRNGGGQGVMKGMQGVVRNVYAGLDVTFNVCVHCGTVLYVSKLDFTAVELADA